MPLSDAEKAELRARLAAPRPWLCPRCGKDLGTRPAEFAGRHAVFEAHRVETRSHGAETDQTGP